MSKYNGFMVKWDDTFAFFDIINKDDIPSISFAFGTADAMEMDFEKLGKIIAFVNWKAIPIWAMAKDNDGGYFVKINDEIEISHIDEGNFFNLMRTDFEVDFKKYDTLVSNYDFKHRKEMEKW